MKKLQQSHHLINITQTDTTLYSFSYTKAIKCAISAGCKRIFFTNIHILCQVPHCF